MKAFKATYKRQGKPEVNPPHDPPTLTVVSSSFSGAAKKAEQQADSEDREELISLELTPEVIV